MDYRTGNAAAKALHGAYRATSPGQESCGFVDESPAGTGASPAGRVDSPWTTLTRCPPPAHTLAPLAHKPRRTTHNKGLARRRNRTTLVL